MKIRKSMVALFFTSVLVACESNDGSNGITTGGNSSGEDNPPAGTESSSPSNDPTTDTRVPNTGLNDDFDINLEGLEITSQGNTGSEDTGASFEVDRSDGSKATYSLDDNQNRLFKKICGWF